MNDLTLTVNGYKYSGWESVTLRRVMEQLAWSFNVSYFEKTGTSEHLLAIREGDACEVKIDDESALVGYVDDSNQSYDATRQSAEISGRSKTGDLIDCAAIYKTGQWRDADVVKIAKDLCAPFDITVEPGDGAGSAPHRRFALQPGETVFEALDRATRMRGLLMLTTGKGGLTFGRAGTKRTQTVLAYGANILKCSYRGSWRDRFSKYIIRTQAAGSDNFSGADAVTLKREATDDGVDRYRPTVLSAENEDSGSELEARVKWERSVRAGRSRRISYTVQGWRDDAGDLWTPNTLIEVDDVRLGLKDTLIIAGVTLSRSLQGTTSDLELTRPEAFSTKPFAPAKPRGGDFNSRFGEGEG